MWRRSPWGRISGVSTAADAPAGATQHRLLLLRHGQTEWSRSGRHTGRTDLELTEEGRQQARSAADALADLKLDDPLVISSPRGRAVVTAELAGLRVAETTELLAEWDYGDYEGLTTPQIREQVPDWLVWTHGCPGGESLADVSARADRAVALALDHMTTRDVVFVGHSVSAMIGVLASIARPERFAQLVLVGPSPRYLNDPDTGYTGGFERADIDGLIDMMDTNMLGWADFLAPAVMGADSPAELTEELRASFCAADPAINRRFALATFLGDNRADLARVTVPTLILQCAHDAIAPCAVGDYLHAQVPGSRLHLAEEAHQPEDAS